MITEFVSNFSMFCRLFRVIATLGTYVGTSMYILVFDLKCYILVFALKCYILVFDLKCCIRT